MRDWSFYRHMPVYLANGRLLGRTEDIGHAVDYVHVQQGHFLVHDWYVPVESVQDVNARGVYLDVTLGHLRRHRWNVPPEPYLARQGATPGYEYTSPADLPSVSDAEESSASIS